MPGYSRAEVLDWLNDLRNGLINLNEDNIGLADAVIRLIDVDQQDIALPPDALTEHFTLAEFTRSDTATQYGLDNTPNEQERYNLERLATTLEHVRHILGDKPIQITSGFRSEAVNKKVGGVPNSAHRQGLAADFVCPAFGTVVEVCNAILPHVGVLGIDQLIYETNSSGGQWVHLGLTNGQPRMQALTIKPSGTQIGIV